MSNDELIAEKIREISKTANDYPGVVIIHNIQQNFNKTEYMSPRGREILGIGEKELSELGSDYFSRYFNEDDAKDYLPKMLELLQKNDTEAVYSYFQQVRTSPQDPWHWYISSTKLLLRDVSAQPLLCITFAAPIDPLHTVTNKVSRLLEENNFLRLNFKQFSSLTKREKEIATQLSKGLTSAQIAKDLHISVDTIKTHRKNIYAKLKIKSFHDLLNYARAFDLI